MINLSREKIFLTFQQFNALLTKEADTKFNYAVIRNKQKLETLIKEIRTQQQNFDKERIALCEKYAEKDEKGKPLFENKNGQNHYKGVENSEEFNKEYEKYEKKVKDYMSEEIEMEVYLIDPQTVPSRLVGLQQEALMPFIDNNNNEVKMEVK